MRKKELLLAALGAVSLISVACAAETISLAGVWDFKYVPDKTDPQKVEWTKIRVPGNWELQGFGKFVYGERTNNDYGIYRRKFTLPAFGDGGRGATALPRGDESGAPGSRALPSVGSAPRADRVILRTEGVQFGYTLKIDGEEIGNWRSSYNRKEWDITEKVKARGVGGGGGREHIIEIVTNNKPKGWGFDTCDDWTLSGIFRDVQIVIRPKDYVTDWRLVTKIDGDKAKISLQLPPETDSNSVVLVTSRAHIAPLRARGSRALRGSLDGVAGTEWTIPVAQLWNAETPILHDFTINGETHKVALREVTWKDGVLKVNGVPVKLRGVNHHDLSPEHGRAITDEELEADVKMIKAANCNFVRLCHYPPNVKMLDLCEKYGLYCLDEVPFAFGSKNLDKDEFFEVLEERARATIARDVNRGCVIIWSVGNENPVTPIVQKTGDLVAKLDPTRPYTFPLIPGRFRDMVTNGVPESIGVIDWHYPGADELAERVPTFTRPFIASEYAHALGLAFAQMEGVWKVMEREPVIAGGAVWMFQDQGVKRVDKNGEYDTNGKAGTDGVVYSDRTPQTDYFELKAVYAPIELEEKILSPKPGKRKFKLQVKNKYDFIDLDKTVCKWQLMGDGKVLDSGEEKVKCPPHASAELVIRTELAPRDATGGPRGARSLPAVRYLTVEFFAPDGHSIIAKSYPIDLDTSALVAGVRTGDAGQETRETLLKPENFRARVSRRETMNIHATRTTPRAVSREHTIWLPHNLAPIAAAEKAGEESRSTKDDNVLSSTSTQNFNFTFKPNPLPPKKPRKDGKKQKPPRDLGVLDGTFAATDADGFTRVEYAYKPTKDWETIEAGFTTLLTKDCTQIRFLGDGPYEAYPAAAKLDNFGLWKLHKDDLYFPGNRLSARAVVIDDGKGNGYLILPDYPLPTTHYPLPSTHYPLPSTFSFAVERTEDGQGILFSHNAHVSGTFSKYVWPTDILKVPAGKTLKGAFRIARLRPASWTPAFRALFGEPDEKIVPFKPGFNSYDR